MAKAGYSRVARPRCYGGLGLPAFTKRFRLRPGSHLRPSGSGGQVGGFRRPAEAAIYGRLKVALGEEEVWPFFRASLLCLLAPVLRRC